MRPLIVCSCVMLILLSLSLLLSLLSINADEDIISPGPVPGSFRIPKSKYGIAYNLAAAYGSSGGILSSDDNFIVSGFKFHSTLPVLVKKITKNFRPANAWLLHGKNAIGNITLQNVQREQPKLEAVLVIINYYTNWNWAVRAIVIVTGRSFNRETNQIEEESEILPDITAGEPPKKGYCQKLVYFGPVDEVKPFLNLFYFKIIY